mmetsp:Transcript_63805/g.149569  ORF Transcript_63805/g.149569 Transcript_63805/m.149569 type:complete len:178 (+) Transcript_63805:50-583(+)|eukprot:s9005_g2.t1
MPVYHSRHNGSNAVSVCGCPLVPLKTARFRGPAPTPASLGLTDEFVDLVDEALRSFRWNILFKNFEVLGDADRVLVYLTLWIQKCLSVASQAGSADDAARQLEVVAASELPGPGDSGFILGSWFKAGPPQDCQMAKAYLKQLRQETASRLLPLFYPDGQPNKWWFQFSKKKFMNIAL